MKGVFRLPEYRRLLLAYALNELAFMIGALALTVLVYRRTGSAVAAAGYFICAEFAPSLLAPAIAARLDRRSPRALLPPLAFAEAIAFLALALLVHPFSLIAVLAISLLDGIIALTARTFARTATVAVLKPPGLLPEGNAVTNAAFTICLMAGPALGGLIVATDGIRPALVAVALAFALIGIVLLGRAGPLAPELAAGSPQRTGVRAALRHLKGQPALTRVLLLQAAGLLFFTIPMPVEIVFVHRSLHTGDGAYGVLLSAWGAGAIVGSGVYARWRRFSGRALVTGGTAMLACGFLVMAGSQDIGLAVAASASGGIGNGIVAVSVRTTLQQHIEDRWLVSIMALSEATSQAVPGAGIVLGGVLAALAGPRVALAVAGVGALAVTLASWLALAPARGSGRGAPDASPSPAPSAPAVPASRAQTSR